MLVPCAAQSVYAKRKLTVSSADLGVGVEEAYGTHPLTKWIKIDAGKTLASVLKFQVDEEVETRAAQKAAVEAISAARQSVDARLMAEDGPGREMVDRENQTWAGSRRASTRWTRR